MTKRGQKQRRYSPEFKKCVIIDRRENYLGYREIVRKYWGAKTREEEDQYRGTVRNWERIYLKEGLEGLMKEKRGRKKIAYKANSEQLTNESKTYKELMRENLLLRMENEYLKKLDALIRAEE